MDTDRNCDKWEKETKWDIQVEHDKQIIADAIDDVWNKANEHSFTDALGIRGVDLSVLENILEQLKQQNSK